jgi:uncharacterized membrane protein
MRAVKLLYLAHVLATVVWVGGMFFAHFCLRPAALSTLDGPQRLKLWTAVFGRFFPWVWLSVATLIATGQGIILQLGGLAHLPVHVYAMTAIGYLMAAIFAFIYFVPYGRLRRAVDAGDWKAGAAAQDHIRKLVVTNLTLGVANVALVFVLPLLPL